MEAVTRHTVWNKVVTRGQAAEILTRGGDLLVGHVVHEADLAAVTEPVDVLAWHGLAGDERYLEPDGSVFVLRFPQEPLQRFVDPRRRADERYPLGFLPAPQPAPVWWLELTRVPIGTVLWQLRPGAEPTARAAYRGLALGWQGADGYTPPHSFVGSRASWAGTELVAARYDGGVEVVSPTPLAGMTQAATGMWQATGDLPAYEVLLTARWQGLPVRVIEARDGRALLALTDPDLRSAATEAGMTEVEPGLWLAQAERSALDDVAAVRREPQPAG
ncbi:MAG TPA: hypothetical protein P5181_06665 [Dermatophilaceae bacterium]|nr:hypothetical protein [Dermatophilaceae bacterium]